MGGNSPRRLKLNGTDLEAGGGACISLDRVDRTETGQSKSEGAEPGEEIDRRPGGTGSGKDLLDEDRLGRRARLQKSAWWEGHGDPGQQNPNRPALDHHDLV